ncbi:MAG TPA: hypothetical protein VL625_00230 [Patescibacteria group bacterium]|nr:hypothetical protein [Patescibacteria group bacterium]
MYSLSRAILFLALVCFMPGIAWAGPSTNAPITTIEVPVVDVQVPQALLAELHPPPQQQPQTRKQTEDSGKRVASAALDIKCDVSGTSHVVSCY